MDDHPENWRKSIKNHIHLLLYRSSRRIKSYDPLFKSPFYKQKNFFTAYGGYTHAKRDFAVMKNIPEVKKTTGNFADVVVEPNVVFYEEVTEIFNNYKNLLNNLKKTAEVIFNMNKNPAFSNLKFSFVNANGIVNHGLDVSEMLIDAIKKQESGTMDEETKNNLKDIISFNSNYNSWMGWFTKLLDPNNQDDIFNFYAWTSRLHASAPIEDRQFIGAIFYTQLQLPFIGLVVKEDKFTKQRKLLLYTSYNNKELVKKFEAEMNFDKEIDDIMERN